MSVHDDLAELRTAWRELMAVLDEALGFTRFVGWLNTKLERRRP